MITMSSQLIFVMLTIVGILQTCAENLNYHKTASCCSHLNDSQALLECINEVETSNPSKNERIAIVTYYSPNIASYASYALAINTAYAEHQGYEFYALSPETGSNFEPADQRWNRVKIMDDALNTKNGWLKDVDYIIWLDADLVMINFAFQFRDLIKKHKNVDIIISAERHAETGVANTGSLILKNTAWSRDYLKKWWNNYDHKKAHDQIFFDVLYKSMYPEVKSHIVILPTDEINSTPPAPIYQLDTNVVLHLMGQRNDFRTTIFQLGFQTLCEAYADDKNSDISNSVSLPAQLGLTQPLLFNEVLKIYFAEVKAFMYNIENRLSDILALDVSKLINYISEIREHLLQIKIYLPNHDLLQESKAVYDLMRKRTKISEKNTTEHKHVISMWHSCAIYCNDVIGMVTSDEEKFKLYEEIEYYLYNLERNVDKGVIHHVYELQGRTAENKGQFYKALNRMDDAKLMFLKALEIFEELGENANPFYGVNPLAELGVIFCMKKEVIDGISGLDYFRQSIALQERLLMAEQQLKQDHIMLARTYLRASGCAAKFNEREQSIDWVNKAKAILTKHPERGAAEPLLQGAYNMEIALKSQYNSLDNDSDDNKEHDSYSPSDPRDVKDQGNSGRTKTKKFMKKKAKKSEF